MGSYCELYVAGFPVRSEKSLVDPLLMTLFRETDKRIFIRPTKERNPIVWGHAEWDPEETETVVEYTSTVAAVKDRLRVMGFTLVRVETEFFSLKQAHLAELTKWMESSSCPELCDLYRAEIDILSRASFEDFLSALKEIVNSGVSTSWFTERMPNASALALYMMKMRNNDDEASYWGFPCNDIRCFLRVVLEVVPDTAPVTQDLTELVSNGYYRRNAPVCKLALQELKRDYSVNSPVIVLTEGRTDSETLRSALDILYPHLTEYYSFMDLAVRSPGGAGSLVHVIKSFAGAGIENRVIAFFDNDTAGRSTASALHGVQLPPTVRVLHYPNIELASQYPTIGPTGTSNQNVNGAACSIELFFGRDVLVTGGSLTPVQWKSFDHRLKQWQGEVQNKDELKDRFFAKVKRAKDSPEVLASQDWDDMRQLLNTMFDAFNPAGIA